MSMACSAKTEGQRGRQEPPGRESGIASVENTLQLREGQPRRSNWFCWLFLRKEMRIYTITKTGEWRYGEEMMKIQDTKVLDSTR